MKMLIILLATVLMQYGAIAADVPTIVEQSFKSKYPSATDIEWYEEESNGYTVYFYDNDQSKTAKFNSIGKWSETRTFLDEAQLPKPVISALKGKFAEPYINAVTLIELPSASNQYEIGVESGETTYHLTYNEKGVLLQTLEEVNNTDHDSDGSDDDSDNSVEEDEKP